MQSTYWLVKVLKMIFLNVNALLCTLQHIDIHALQLSEELTPLSCIACMTKCCSVHKSAVKYKIIFSTFSNQYVGNLESKERLRIQPAQLFHFS